MDPIFKKDKCQVFFFFSDNCLLNILRLMLQRFDGETFIKEYYCYYVLMCLFSEFLPRQRFVCQEVNELVGCWNGMF